MMPPLTFPSHPLFRAAALANRSPEGLLRFFRALFFALTIILFLWAVVATNSFFVALAALVFAVFFICHLWLRFISFYQGRGLTELEADGTSAWIDVENRWMNYIDFASARFLATLGNTHDPVSFGESLFASDVGTFFSRRTGIPIQEILGELRQAYGAPATAAETSQNSRVPGLDLAKLARRAADTAVQSGNSFITPADFFAAFAEIDQHMSDILIRRGFHGRDFDFLADWMAIAREHRTKPFLERLLSDPGIGKTWAYAYTPFLDRMSSRIGFLREDELHVRAHRKTIRELEESLSKSSAANAILVGDPGVGKGTIIEGLAENIRQGRSLPTLNFRRVRRLNMEDVVSQPAFGTIEATIGRVFHESEAAGNIVLVIEDIENYMSQGAPTHVAEGLLPFFHSPLVKVVALTTPEGFAKANSDYPAMATLFHEIRVEEPDEETMITILEDAALALERRYRSVIQYQALRSVFELARQYLTNTPFPEKAVTLLDEVFVAASASHTRIITPQAVEAVMSRKVGSVVMAPGKIEGEVLLNLEERIHKRVVNQEGAISAIADAVRRKRAGISAAGRPAGSFLFLGPTGVGKTETAKALAETYFGSDEKMIRLDMSEYQNPADLARLIGSRNGHESGFLAREIRAKPFSLLLLDEVEKAHPNILDFFLQILDEGHAKDAYDKKIDFTNAIIVATSNAGSEFIRQSLSSAMPYPELQSKLIDEVLKKGIFRPEFLNRFDGAIVFTPLSLDHVKKVAELMLKNLSKRLEERGFRLAWGDDLIQWLAERGYSQIFGGRELRRVVQNTLESAIAKEILSGNHPKGSTITVTITGMPQA